MQRKIKNGLSVVALMMVWPVQVWASNFHYAVIIDAGSSGSRAHVFEYLKSSPQAPVPVINDVFNQRTSPGLSSYATAPLAAGSSLKPILDAVAIDLQHRGVNLVDVPVHVLATAGMRLLSPVEQDAIYSNVRSYIRSHYAFELKQNNQVRTISGVEEGAFGWLDVNYLMHHFVDPKATIGSIDMGGASTQIAFATMDTNQQDNEIAVTINHTPYRIYSQSFLGLGQDQARRSMSADEGASSCYPDGYPLDAERLGYFNFAPCSAIYQGILQDQNVSNRILPTAGQSFVAYSGIYYNYHFFEIQDRPTQSTLQAKIAAVCYLPWSTLQINYPDTSPAFLASVCANSVYADDLLYNTYQLQDSQLQVTDAIKGTGIDWTLGALLYSLVQ